MANAARTRMHCVHTRMRCAHQLWLTRRRKRFGLAKEPRVRVIEAKPYDEISPGMGHRNPACAV